MRRDSTETEHTVGKRRHSLSLTLCNFSPIPVSGRIQTNQQSCVGLAKWIPCPIWPGEAAMVQHRMNIFKIIWATRAGTIDYQGRMREVVFGKASERKRMTFNLGLKV